MKAFKIAVAVALCVLVSANALSAQTVTRSSGGLAQTKHGEFHQGVTGNYDVNEESTLVREWITVHDDSIPAGLRGHGTFDSKHGTVGIETVYYFVGLARDGANYNYRAEYSVTAEEGISAIEVKFLLFDVWGNLTKTLSATDVIYIPAGTKEKLLGLWHASEHDVKVHYASIAYIARVRTKSGRVIEANTKTVLEEARKFSKKFSESDLESQPSKE